MPPDTPGTRRADHRLDNGRDDSGAARGVAARETRMLAEAAEAPAVVERQLRATSEIIGRLGEALRRRPAGIVTLARGSSDHAATYARYLVETRLGILTSSAAPSVSSLYEAGGQFRDTLLLAISQSGKSPDLLATASAARESGARVVALVNDEDSPLARLADDVLPMCAGEESSVAATKSFIASLSAIVHLVARWTADDELLDALHRLPDALGRAFALDWDAAIEPLAAATSLFAIGRGLGLGIAGEAALKLKETCRLHAEAISAAELRHGPLAIVGPDFPLLVFTQRDATLGGSRELVEELVAQRARVFAIGVEVEGAASLPACRAHPVLEPILQAQAFYRFANALALRRGFDPDRPVNLSKVTETL